MRERGAARPGREAVAGAWVAVTWTLVGRPAVGTALLEAGMLEVAVAQLAKTSAVEWANWRSGLHDGMCFAAVALLCSLELPGLRLSQRLVDSGMASAMTSLIKVRPSGLVFPSFPLRSVAVVDSVRGV